MTDKLNKTLTLTLKEVENRYVLDVLAQENGSRKMTAAILGRSYRWLLYKLEELRDNGEVIRRLRH